MPAATAASAPIRAPGDSLSRVSASAASRAKAKSSSQKPEAGETRA